MRECHLDHLVVVAASLEAGSEYVRRALGVSLQTGGSHERMGTHNSLLRLGNTMYLEVIAIDPCARCPGRPRWFDLDRLDANAPPRLAAWIARTHDIPAAADASPLHLGDIEPMSRGPFNWLITLTRDGEMPAAGVAPMLIQWLSASHPVANLLHADCSLVRLEGFHPEFELIASMLTSVRFEGDFSVAPRLSQDHPSLVAHIRTPSGVRTLM